jgi:hypothetical protein
LKFLYQVSFLSDKTKFLFEKSNEKKLSIFLSKRRPKQMKSHQKQQQQLNRQQQTAKQARRAFSTALRRNSLPR